MVLTKVWFVFPRPLYIEMLKGKSISQKASSSSVPTGSEKLVHGVGVGAYPAPRSEAVDGAWLVVLAADVLTADVLGPT